MGWRRTGVQWKAAWTSLKYSTADCIATWSTLGKNCGGVLEAAETVLGLIGKEKFMLLLGQQENNG